MPAPARPAPETLQAVLPLVRQLRQLRQLRAWFDSHR